MILGGARRVVVGCVFTLVLVPTVASCSSAPTDSQPASLGPIEVPADSSQFQRDVVAAFQSGQKVTFEDYSEAVRDTKACLVSLGFEITDEQNTTVGGMPTMTYNAKVPKALADKQGEDFFDAAYQECWQNNSAVVESLYSNAGVSVAEQEANLQAVKDKYAPLIEDCLHDLGIDKPAGADAEWWGEAVIDANQSLPGNPDCMETSGYTDAVNGLPGSGP